MTGPEHYREAERLLEHAAVGSAGEDLAVDAVRDRWIARAAVHAQLATAAAVGLAIRGADSRAWEAAAGPREEVMPTALDIVDGRRG